MLQKQNELVQDSLARLSLSTLHELEQKLYGAATALFKMWETELALVITHKLDAIHFEIMRRLEITLTKDCEMYNVRRDKEVKFIGTENECWIYILNNQGQSVHWAMTHEGWTIDPVNENEDAQPEELQTNAGCKSNEDAPKIEEPQKGMV